MKVISWKSKLFFIEIIVLLIAKTQFLMVKGIMPLTILNFVWKLT